MSIRIGKVLATLALAGTAALAVAASSLQHRLTPAEIDSLPAQRGGVGTSLLSSMQTTVLFGDPSRPGLYTIRIRIPPHTSIQPHRHRDTRSAVVVSGTWYFGYGEKLDTKALKALPAGSFYTEPGGEAHFAQTQDEAVVVFITGYGPSSTDYVEPQHAPTP